MRKSLFTEAQIVGILKQAEAGRMVIDLCREHGITQATSYRWRSMYERVGECEGRVSIVPRGAAAPATQAAPQGIPGPRGPLQPCSGPKQRWSLDFVKDSLGNERRLRIP